MTSTKIKRVLKKFGWKAWLGIGLLVVTTVMTFVAIPTGLGESVQYVTFISHVAIILTALDMIWTARVSEKNDED